MRPPSHAEHAPQILVLPEENVAVPPGLLLSFGVDVIETGTDFLPGLAPTISRHITSVGSALAVTTDRVDWRFPALNAAGGRQVGARVGAPVRTVLVPVRTVLLGAAKFRVTVSGCDQSLDQSDRGVDGGGVQTGFETAFLRSRRQCVEHIAARSR